MSSNAEAQVASPDPSTQPPGALLGKPFVQLALSILFSAAAQVLLKRGAVSGGENDWFGFGGLQSGWVWMGIAAMIISLFSWLYALRSMPLSIAFTLAGSIHVLVPLASWIWLGEAISNRRWMGILLVVAGVVISARPATEVEEKL